MTTRAAGQHLNPSTAGRHTCFDKTNPRLIVWRVHDQVDHTQRPHRPTTRSDKSNPTRPGHSTTADYNSVLIEQQLTYLKKCLAELIREEDLRDRLIATAA